MRHQHFWICRHGETTHNVEGRIQGVLDSGLTERGRLQARLLGEYFRALRDNDGANLVASPLHRTKSTARIVGSIAGLIPCYHDALKELGRGILEGKLKGQLSAEDRKHNDNFKADPWTYRVPGGETFTELRARVNGFLAELETAAVDCHVIITHGFVVRMIVAQLIGDDVSGFRAPHDTVHYVQQCAGGVTYRPVLVTS